MSYDAFVGVDWASREHAACGLDPAGGRKDQFPVDHTEEGLDRLTTRLAGLGPPAQVLVAIERPDGIVVDRLLEAGHPVLPLKPAAVTAYRHAIQPSKAKSDPGDAWVIAEYARLTHQRLAPLRPFSDAIRALRASTRARTQLVRRRVRATNQLTAVLEANWPGPLAAFDLDSDIGVAFLRRYPTPESAAHLGPKRLEAFLRRAGYSGGWQRSPDQILAELRNAPAGVTSGPLTDGCEAVVAAHVEVLAGLRDTIKRLDRVIVDQLRAHPDGVIFSSFPHAGKINAAQLLAEWGDTRQAYPAPESVAALAGTAPVTREWGEHRVVLFRWACNKWLRQAMDTFADNSRHGSPWAAEVYRQARAGNRKHPHAIRILGRAWIRVMWRCWIDHKPYDPALHGNARAMTA